MYIRQKISYRMCCMLHFALCQLMINMTQFCEQSVKCWSKVMVSMSFCTFGLYLLSVYLEIIMGLTTHFGRYVCPIIKTNNRQILFMWQTSYYVQKKLTKCFKIKWSVICICWLTNFLSSGFTCVRQVHRTTGSDLKYRMYQITRIQQQKMAKWTRLWWSRQSIFI